MEFGTKITSLARSNKSINIFSVSPTKERFNSEEAKGGETSVNPTRCAISELIFVFPVPK
jgi:hypothetical protein